MISITELMHTMQPEQLFDLDIGVSSTIPFHVYWKDLEGKYLGCNDAQAKFTGLEKGSDVIGHDDFDLCWSPHAPCLIRNDKEVWSQNSAKVFIEPCLTNSGKSVSSLSYKMPLRNRLTQKVIGVLGVSYIFDDESPSSSLYDINELTDLTPRQFECLYHLIKGKSLKQIGHRLGLSARTVEHYLNAVKIKLRCHNRQDLIEKGLQLPYLKIRLLMSDMD